MGDSIEVPANALPCIGFHTPLDASIPGSADAAQAANVGAGCAAVGALVAISKANPAKCDVLGAALDAAGWPLACWTLKVAGAIRFVEPPGAPVPVPVAAGTATKGFVGIVGILLTTVDADEPFEPDRRVSGWKGGPAENPFAALSPLTASTDGVGVDNANPPVVPSLPCLTLSSDSIGCEGPKRSEGSDF